MKMQNAWDMDGEVRTQKSFSLCLEDFFMKVNSLGIARSWDLIQVQLEIKALSSSTG